MIAGITALLARERELDRRLADRVGLLEVGLRREMARRALQVVGDRPVVLVAELVLARCAAISGPTPPSCAWPNASRVPASARSLPSASCRPSETPTQQ